MEENKSLSARVKRRNAQGFKGEGSHADFHNGGGNYFDLKQNHKERDYKDAAARKSRLGFNKYTKNRQLCRKYADKHQRLR